MTGTGTHPAAGLPFAAAFESSPTPAVALAGAPQRVVALNAAARSLLGDPTGEPLRRALPGAGQALYDACERVTRSGRAERAAAPGWRGGAGGAGVVGAAGAPEVLLAPWHDAPGGGGLVAHLTGPEDAGARRERADGAGALLEAVLPRDVPVLPGLDAAAAYVVADGNGEGAPRADWFDVWPVAPVAVAVSVGDVVGTGTEAVAAMTALRAVLRERLSAGAGPAQAVAAADRLARELPGAGGASTCVAVVDLPTGEAQYVTAGHPPPLVVSGGAATPLDRTGAPLLGAGGGPPRARAVRLEEGDLLLLHTDTACGAGDWTSGLPDPLSERLSEEVVRTRLAMLQDGRGGSPSGRVDDDLAVVALHRVPAPAVLRLELAAEPASVPRARHALAHWLGRLGVGELDELAVQHVADELVANAVRHPYRDEPAAGVVLTAELEPGRVRLTVRDRGPWRPPEQSGDCRGLVIARELSESVEVRRGRGGGKGTEVRASVRAGRPAGLLASSQPSRHAPTADLALEDGTDGVLRVSGTLDLASREELRDRLLAASQGGVRPLDVDLSGVSLLDSAALRTLREVSSWTVDQEPAIHLVAAPGTRAQQALSVAGVSCGSPPGR